MAEVISETGPLNALQRHHVVICTRPDKPVIILGFADADNNVQEIVEMDLNTANIFGETFCERYNEALRRARNEV